MECHLLDRQGKRNLQEASHMILICIRDNDYNDCEGIYCCYCFFGIFL
jgi:hypothetical protein